MLVIQTANGNVYPAETCVWRTEQVSTGGYRLTHFDIHNPNVGTSGTGTAAPTGAQLGYIGKSGRFVAYTEPAV